MEEKILEINDLKVFDSRSKKEIVKGISFFVNRGECTAIVGESGSGKSISCKTILGLNKFWIENTGKIRFNGEDISNKKPKERRKLCGSKISLILQNGIDAFDPSCKMKVHFRESLKANFAMSRSDADALMINVMKSVMLKDPEDILEKYPHQLS